MKMSNEKDEMVYDDRFGWIDLPEDGDILKAIGIDVDIHTDAILYCQRSQPGLLHRFKLWIPKNRTAIEAMRACLDDAEHKMNAK